MLSKQLEQRFEEIKKISKDLGFDPFDINFEIVTNDIMHEICAYGLPTRARHWSHGAAFEHNKIYGEMGYSKVYEVILNNNPAYAFLLETNKDIDNTMVAAHVIGHSHYFKNNALFANSDRNMVYHAAERANRIEAYIEEYGIDKVEKIMDIAFSLDRHIDPHKGVFRKKYDDAKTIKVQHQRGEFDDLLPGKRRPVVEYKKIGQELPPYPEKDFLWFLANYAKLEHWEKDILEIIREESHYFYPQYMTKISNEGLASYAHTEIMHRMNLTPGEMIDFACTHERVVQPGSNPFRMNPYYLGLKILRDVEKKYGIDKMFDVCSIESDTSLIRNYLTGDLVQELGLFNYGYKCETKHAKGQRCSDCSFIELKDKDLDKIINSLIRPMQNYGVPNLAITKINGDIMTITHTPDEFGTMDFKYAERTMELMFQLWGAPIEIETIDEEGKPLALSYDETGFEIITP